MSDLASTLNLDDDTLRDAFAELGDGAEIYVDESISLGLTARQADVLRDVLSDAAQQHRARVSAGAAAPVAL